MKHLVIAFLVLGCLVGAYSCKSGPSKEELAAQEQAKIDSIKRATADSIRLADSLAKVKADSIAKAKADSIANSYGIFDANGNPKDGTYTLTGSGYGVEGPEYTFPITIKMKVKNGFAQIISENGNSLNYPPIKCKGKTIEYNNHGDEVFDYGISLTAKDKRGINWSGEKWDTGSEYYNLKLKR